MDSSDDDNAAVPARTHRAGSRKARDQGKEAQNPEEEDEEQRSQSNTHGQGSPTDPDPDEDPDEDDEVDATTQVIRHMARLFGLEKEDELTLKGYQAVSSVSQLPARW